MDDLFSEDGRRFAWEWRPPVPEAQLSLIRDRL